MSRSNTSLVTSVVMFNGVSKLTLNTGIREANKREENHHAPHFGVTFKTVSEGYEGKLRHRLSLRD